MKTQTYDITNFLFPLEESDTAVKEWELWSKATDEAYKLVGSKSSIELLHKTQEIYNNYAREEK
jgi:hypothetical protein